MDWPSSNISTHPEWEEGMPNGGLGHSCMFVSSRAFAIAPSPFAGCFHLLTTSYTVFAQRFVNSVRTAAGYAQMSIHTYWRSLGPATV